MKFDVGQLEKTFKSDTKTGEDVENKLKEEKNESNGQIIELIETLKNQNGVNLQISIDRLREQFDIIRVQYDKIDNEIDKLAKFRI